MKHILVIEDDKTTAFLIEQVLSKKGYQSTIVEDGGDALDVFKKLSFDAVVTDVYLPNKDGLSILEDIKKEASETIVIVMSGGSFKGYDVLTMALEKGADKTVRKPEDVLRLGDILTSCFDKTRNGV